MRKLLPILIVLCCSSLAIGASNVPRGDGATVRQGHFNDTIDANTAEFASGIAANATAIGLKADKTEVEGLVADAEEVADLPAGANVLVVDGNELKQVPLTAGMVEIATDPTAGEYREGTLIRNTATGEVWAQYADSMVTFGVLTSIANVVPDTTPPTASTFAYDATGLSLSFVESETATVDCTQLTAAFATAGTISDYIGTSSPCVSTTPVYSGDTGTIAGATGFLTDTALNESVAFSGVAVDNTANTATDSGPVAGELIVNADDRDFSSDTGFWAMQSGYAISGGEMVLTAASYTGFSNSIVLTDGETYTVSFDLTLSGGPLSVGSNTGTVGVNSCSVAAGGPQNCTFVAAGTMLIIRAGGTPVTGTVDNISLVAGGS